MGLSFLPGKISDLKDVYRLIDDRIKWMDEVGIKQWNVTDYYKHFPHRYFEMAVDNLNLYVLKNKVDRVVGAAVIKSKDSWWDDDKQAYYIHNFVTDIEEKGAGIEMLKGFEDIALKNNIYRVRLDCAKDNVKLNRYYEQFGYNVVGECIVGDYIGNKREKILCRL